MLLRFIRDIASSLFLFTDRSFSTVWMCYILSLCSPADGHLGSLQIELLWTFLCVTLCGPVFVSVEYIGTKSLWRMIVLCLTS